LVPVGCTGSLVAFGNVTALKSYLLLHTGREVTFLQRKRYRHAALSQVRSLRASAFF